MKNLLAIALAAASVVASQAAIIDLSASITGSPDIIGDASGSYDTSTGLYGISGSLFSLTGAVPTSLIGTIEAPGGYVDTLSISYNDGTFTFFANGPAGVNGHPPVAPYPTSWPAGFSVNFYLFTPPTISKIASGALVGTPEPQTYALAAGAALLGFAAFRRARR